MSHKRKLRRDDLLDRALEAKPAHISLDGVEHSCGGTFHTLVEPAPVHIRGRDVEVDQERYRCDGCGEELFDLWQVDDARVAAARKLNEDEGLLQPEEIKELRESLGLTQTEFEKALGIGEKTVIRWEKGKVLPSQAMAMLLLLIKRDPAAMVFLADKRGVRLRSKKDSRAIPLSVCPFPGEIIVTDMSSYLDRIKYGGDSHGVAV